MSKKSVVVIIPYFNESKTILSTLKSVDQQTVKPTNVILVDSGSTDVSFKLVKKWIKDNKKSNYQNIFSGEMSPSSSINNAIYKSSEEIIAYIDCGLEIPNNWLATSLYEMEKNNADMVSLNIFTTGINSIDEAFIAQTYGYKKNRTCLPGSLIKREVFDSVGLFIEKVRASYDIDFVNKFQKYNYKRILNKNIFLKYIDTNYAIDFFNGAKKVFSYSLDGWNVKGDYKPHIYISIFLLVILNMFINLFSLIHFIIFYIFIRTLIIPLYKSFESKELIKSIRIIYLFCAGFIIDISRLLGYMKSIIKHVM